MDRAEALRQIAQLHRDWAEKWSARLVVPPREQDPYKDYPNRMVHDVDLYAPQEAEDEYWSAAKAIMDQIDR